ncbi:hypothetical protein RhiirC2_781411 [Rhizophagus irregularis]|uniref:Uncharacterized protein n=1 Tax=Rhizophagus irregularis TaxID=588596 RepID=A0A2N1N5C5_9GLOM|nr:hypothetical protein RhiirC2_781411 [Rhizophagus irregularis]
MRNIGPCQNPLGPFLLIQVLKLYCFIKRLELCPRHENAKKYMWNGFDCILAFGVKGDANVGAAFIDALQLAR